MVIDIIIVQNSEMNTSSSCNLIACNLGNYECVCKEEEEDFFKFKG